jgi:hypothetical protein
LRPVDEECWADAVPTPIPAKTTPSPTKAFLEICPSSPRRKLEIFFFIAGIAMLSNYYFSVFALKLYHRKDWLVDLLRLLQSLKLPKLYLYIRMVNS